MDKSLDELLAEHNKALENINLALNRILTQQEQILSAFQELTEDIKVEEDTEPQNYDGFTDQ
jgi:uncharacterized protein YoxC